MRPLVAHCHLGLGKLYRRTGKPERAREHLTAATTMYREMDMGFWLEQGEAEQRCAYAGWRAFGLPVKILEPTGRSGRNRALAREREPCRTERSADPRPSVPFSCLPHLLEHQAKRIPDAPAILAPGALR